MNPKELIKRILRRNGKSDFLSKLSSNSSILDVGCGNNSPFRTKDILPNCDYVGLDIGDYNQTKPIIADRYVLTTPQDFANEIGKFREIFDAVISSHNLEHCNDRDKTLQAMLGALKINGKLFLSFPCEESVGFPSRVGTLNYYDDSTHKLSPPNFDKTLSIIEVSGFEVEYAQKNYSPKILSFLGLICEPLSKMRNRVMIGTWEYYGFESIIIAKKVKQIQTLI
jgi:SAM-dependent methyltransferase